MLMATICGQSKQAWANFSIPGMLAKTFFVQLPTLESTEQAKAQTQTKNSAAKVYPSESAHSPVQKVGECPKEKPSV